MNTKGLYLLTLACRFVRILCHQRLPSNKNGSRLLVLQSYRSCLLQFSLRVPPTGVSATFPLSLDLRVPGKGLACGVECWLPWSVSNPAPVQSNLYVNWLLSRSLPKVLHFWSFQAIGCWTSARDIYSKMPGSSGESFCSFSISLTPYNMADFTLELSIRCLVVVQMFLQAQMF